MAAYSNSEALRQRVRQLINDTSNDPGTQIWSESEIDSALIDAFGYVTYGERDEGGADSFDISLSKLSAGATLVSTLVRDKARLARWKTSAGEEHSSGEIAQNLQSLANSWMKQVDKALERRIQLMSDGVKTKAPTGATVTWNSISVSHQDVSFGNVDKANRPASPFKR